MQRAATPCNRYARIFHASAKAAAMRKFDNMVDLNAPLFNARVKAIFADALVLAGVLRISIPIFDKP